MKAIVDTSFLLFCVERGKDFIRLLEEKVGDRLEPVVPLEVVDELKRLSAGSGKKSKMAETALKLARTMQTIDQRYEGPVDSAIVKHAERTGYPVVSLDSHLIEKLVSRKIEYLTFSAGGEPVVRLKFR